MKITAQNGKEIEVRAIGLGDREILCLFPKANRCVLGKYESFERTVEVFRALGKHEISSDDVFVMPQE